MPAPSDRREEIQAAALRSRAARVLPGVLAGPYEGPHRGFEVVWDEAAQAYRRDFEDDGAWLWDEARTWSALEVLQELDAGRWRLCTVRTPSGRPRRRRRRHPAPAGP
jgi:hypothetical protein